MDKKKATNQQLYQIAMDESNRMRDRYAAASELQRRKKQNVVKNIDIQNQENRWF